MTVVEPRVVLAAAGVDAVGAGEVLLDASEARMIDDISDRLLTWMRSVTSTDDHAYRAAS